MSITPEEAHERLQKDDDIVVLDVREDFEIDVASIEEDFIHIPMKEIPNRLDDLPKDKDIAVLCHTGGRSARATNYLKQQGFENVFNVKNGIERWARKADDRVPRYRKSFGQAQKID